MQNKIIDIFTTAESILDLIEQNPDKSIDEILEIIDQQNKTEENSSEETERV